MKPAAKLTAALRRGRRVAWALPVATEHAAADARCGRPWECSCGPCREVRSGFPTPDDARAALAALDAAT